VGSLRKVVDINWWMLPAVVLILWRAWIEGELWLYFTLVTMGGLGGILLMRRGVSKRDQLHGPHHDAQGGHEQEETRK
jgi:hypothetical protein